MKRILSVAFVLFVVVWLSAMVVYNPNTAQSRPIEPMTPEITIYRVEMEDGTQMRCAVTTWYTNLSIDCNWPQGAR